MMGLYSPLDGMQSPFGTRRKTLFDRVMDLEPFGMWDFGAAGFQSRTMQPIAIGAPVGFGLDMAKGVRLAGDQMFGLGPELWNDAAVLVEGGSQDLGGGRYRIFSEAGAYSAIRVSNVLDDTETTDYLVTFDVENVTDGQVRAGNSGATWNSPGPVREIITSNSKAAILKRVGVTDVIVSGISIREIPGNHFVTDNIPQSPTWHAAGVLDFDGLDDQLSARAPTAGFPENADVFLAIRTTDGNFIPVSRSDLAGYLLSAHSTDTSTALVLNTGDNTSVHIDGAPFPGHTRVDLHSALADGKWHLTGVENADLSKWSGLTLSGHGGIWDMDGQFGPRIYIHDNVNGPLTDHNRALIERWVMEGLT